MPKSPPVQLTQSKKELNVVVMHPEKTIYDGKAKALTSVNDRGTFDILPFHSNFVSLIKDKVIVYELQGAKRELKIEKAILKVHNNKVWVFVGISEERGQENVME